VIVLYTEEQLGAAFQIYARAQADEAIGILPFEKFREMFELQFIALANPDMVFNNESERTH